jgi:hypothetical protein
MYDGEWKNDLYHGFGTQTIKNGQVKYVGEFKEGKRHGHGTLENGGHKYTGAFVNDEFHGKGRYENPDKGRIMEGDFEHNEFIRGKMYLEDGSVYEGEHNQGLMHGAGSITYPNGNVYVGTFEND